MISAPADVEVLRSAEEQQGEPRDDAAERSRAARVPPVTAPGDVVAYRVESDLSLTRLTESGPRVDVSTPGPFFGAGGPPARPFR